MYKSTRPCRFAKIGRGFCLFMPIYNTTPAGKNFPIPPEKFPKSLENFISRLEMYIFRLEIHIFRLEMYISRLEI